MDEHPATPATNIIEGREDKVAVVVVLTFKNGYQCFSDGQKEDRDEVRRDLVENLEGPRNGELLLREGVGDIHDIKDDEQNKEDEEVDCEDPRVEVNTRHVFVQVEQAENVKDHVQKG